MSCDPYVRLELAPYSLFPPTKYVPQLTRVCYSTTEPIFEQTFMLYVCRAEHTHRLCSDMPYDDFFTYGASLCVHGLDHDRITHDDFAGNGYISLANVPMADADSCFDTGASTRAACIHTQHRRRRTHIHRTAHNVRCAANVVDDHFQS
jgi:hypothetical protein